MKKTAGLSLCLVLASALAPARATNLCETIVHGGSVVSAVAGKSDKTIAFNEDAPLLDKAPSYAASQFGEYDHVRIYPMGTSGAVAIETIEGTAHCQTLIFYDQVAQHPKKVKAPWLGPSCDGTGTPASIATVMGVPALIKVHDAGNLEFVIQINGWENHRWDVPCDLAVRFAKGGHRILSTRISAGAK